MLSVATPASFVAFDLLAIGDDDLMNTPLVERRAALERALADAQPPIHITPATRDAAEAQRWFEEFEGAGLDGLIAKKLDLRYQPDKRVMSKIKHERTADCVVAGYRVHKSGPDAIGSVLLGLYDDRGVLASVGRHRRVPDGDPQEAVRRAAAVGHHLRRPPVELGRARGGRTDARGRTRPAAGTSARTCPSSRCARSGWSRSATTTWRASGSGTPRSSSGGARIVTRNPAPTTSSTGPSGSTWPTC